MHMTNGFGADAVIITAGTDSHDPVDLAGALCRKKGKVVIVGAVPTGFKRANYFRKELDLRMSCSYGPGRYDASYEEQGVDYPYAYVRWTERRNMQAFIDLLQTGKLRLEPLITHEFTFSNAPQAYDMILGKTESYAGIVLKYDIQKELKASVSSTPRSYAAEEVNIGLIGAGAFAQNFLLPALEGQGNFAGIVTSRPNSSGHIAAKYKFGFSSGRPADLFTSPDVNTVFIASRHDSHAHYVLEALRHSKHVFVEKPLCLTEQELNLIANEYVKSGKQLMVGFNRRFAPLIDKLRKSFPPSSPVSINIRINAGAVAADHWTQQPTIGGGRILGEACHFIDLASFLAGDRIRKVSALALDDAQRLNDNVVVQMQFANGSIASLSYFSNGSKLVEKESIEVFGSGTVAQLRDFKELVITGQSVKKHTATLDKGHRAEVTAFCDAIRTGKPAPISFDEIYSSMSATFKVLESLAQNGKDIVV